MSEPEDIQRLIRLKKYEKAPPDLAEDIIISLHQRIRSEALKQQQIEGSFWERLQLVFGEAFFPRLGMALAALAVLMAAWMLLAPKPQATEVIASPSQKTPAAASAPQPAGDSPKVADAEGLKTGKVFSVAGVHVLAQLIDADEASDPSLLGNHFNSEPHHVVVFDASGHGKMHTVTIQALPEDEAEGVKGRK